MILLVKVLHCWSDISPFGQTRNGESPLLEQNLVSPFSHFLSFFSWNRLSKMTLCYINLHWNFVSFFFCRVAFFDDTRFCSNSADIIRLTFFGFFLILFFTFSRWRRKPILFLGFGKFLVLSGLFESTVKIKPWIWNVYLLCMAFYSNLSILFYFILFLGNVHLILYISWAVLRSFQACVQSELASGS